MTALPPVLVTVPLVEVLRQLGLPDTWHCLGADYDAAHESIVLRFQTPFDTIDRPQVFVEGDH